MIKKLFISLLQERWAKWSWQFLEQFLLTCKIWHLLDLRFLYDIISDLGLQLFRHMCFLSQRSKHFQFWILFHLILSDAVDPISNIVDIIPKKHNCKEWDSDDKNCFNVIGGMNISKSNCQDYSCTKVVAPYILLIPGTLKDTCLYHPVLGHLMKVIEIRMQASIWQTSRFMPITLTMSQYF